MNKKHTYYPVIVLFGCILISLSLGTSNDWRWIPVRYGEIVPLHSIVSENSSITLYVGSAAYVTWRFPSNASSVYRHKRYGHKLILNNLIESDSGAYSCYGKYSDGQVFYRVAFVDVYRRPDPGMVLPYPFVEASEGDSVKLACGSVKPVKWIGLQHYLKGNNELRLNQLKVNDSGPFLCIGVNENNEVFHETTGVTVNTLVEVVPGNYSDLIGEDML